MTSSARPSSVTGRPRPCPGVPSGYGADTRTSGPNRAIARRGRVSMPSRRKSVSSSSPPTGSFSPRIELLPTVSSRTRRHYRQLPRELLPTAATLRRAVAARAWIMLRGREWVVARWVRHRASEACSDVRTPASRGRSASRNQRVHPNREPSRVYRARMRRFTIDKACEAFDSATKTDSFPILVWHLMKAAHDEGRNARISRAFGVQNSAGSPESGAIACCHALMRRLTTDRAGATFASAIKVGFPPTLVWHIVKAGPGKPPGSTRSTAKFIVFRLSWSPVVVLETAAREVRSDMSTRIVGSPPAMAPHRNILPRCRGCRCG